MSKSAELCESIYRTAINECLKCGLKLAISNKGQCLKMLKNGVLTIEAELSNV